MFNLKDDVGKSDNLRDTNPGKFDELKDRFENWKKEVVNTDDPIYVSRGKDQYGNGR